MEQENTKGVETTAPEWIEYESPAGNELLKIRADLAALKGKPHTFADVAAIMRRLSEAARKCGGYYLAAPESLLKAGEAYFHTHAEQVRAALEQGGADSATIDAVLYDYGGALCGLTEFTATPQQMQIALNAVSPAVAYNIDKYGFFTGVLLCYQRNQNAIMEYQREVKQEPDAAKRDLYFNSEVSGREFIDLRAAALYWLEKIGYITAADFAGVEQETIKRFLFFIETYGTDGHFIQYVFIAKNALNATNEQLKELPAPPMFSRARISPIQAALNYADIVGAEIALYLERAEEQFKFTAPAPDQSGEPLTGEITRPVEAIRADEQPGALVPAAVELRAIYMPEIVSLLNSRDVWAAPEEKGVIRPITAFISDFVRRNPQYNEIGTYPIIKAIDGVNILRQSPAARFDGDRYIINTNLTEFSDACGSTDANEREKQALLTALMVLSNLYVVVWRQRGRVAVKLLTVREIGLDKQERGKLKIEVYANALKGRPNIISLEEYKEMKKTVTGESKAHFLFQMISGNNKKENTLISEVFGYDTKKQDAQDTGDSEQVRAVEEYERKNRPRDRKYLQKWFTEWTEKGLITYTRTKNKGGEFVYKWKRLKPLTEDEKAAISEMRKKYNLPD